MNTRLSFVLIYECNRNVSMLTIMTSSKMLWGALLPKTLEHMKSTNVGSGSPM